MLGLRHKTRHPVFPLILADRAHGAGHHRDQAARLTGRAAWPARGGLGKRALRESGPGTIETMPIVSTSGLTKRYPPGSRRSTA